MYIKKYFFSFQLIISLFISSRVYSQSYGINTSGAIPDSSAMLDIISSNKGLLIPRVSLTSTTDSATIAHPAISLQVYNTNASMTGGGKGFWYWSGTRWIKSIAASGSDSLAVNASVSTPLLIGGSTTTSSLTYKTTTATGTTGADHIFKVGNNGGTEAMRILNSGNVGVGTTTPDIFSFGGSGYKYFTVTSSTASAYGIANLVGGTSGGGKVDFGATGSLRQATIATLNGSHLVFYTNNSNSGTSVSERMRINNTGEIGLGTTSPNFKVHINHSTSVRNALNDVLALENSCTGNAPYLGHGQGIVFYDRTYWFATKKVLSRIYSVVNDHSASYDGTDLVFQTIGLTSDSVPTTKMIIRYNGNVGIGTTAPTALIHGIKTTEQLRLGYDASNYYSTTVSSTGTVTFNATGSGATFTFSDAVTLANNSTASTQALNDSTTKIATTAFVDRAVAGASSGSGWGLTGNSGTTDGTHFIGTTDNKPFNLKVNNQKAGRVDNSLGNVFWGYQAGNSNTSGYWNTAIGDQALKSNTSGASNTATGNQALIANTTGAYNTAIGDVALKSNTSGDYNTATGQQALYYNTTGNANTATGMQALAVNTTGGYNTAMGYGALNANTTGTHNTAAGYGAAATNTTGYYNTFLGYATDVNANNYSNSTAIGYAAIATANNYIKIGNSSVATIGGQVSWTTISDGRFKTNISDTDIKGLDFIMKLRPVSYNLNTRQYEEFITKNMPDSIKTRHFSNRDFAKSAAVRHNGFVAQEVELAAQQVGYEFSGLHKPETADDNYGLAYSEFVVPLVKAMQEQQQLIEIQQQQSTAKDAKITVLENKLEALTNRLQQLESKNSH